MPAQSDDLSARLSAALAKAQAAKAAAAPATTTAATSHAAATGMSPAESDAFSSRLRAALQSTHSRTTPAPAATQPTQPGGPVGTGDYLVRSGDSIGSIALDHGHFWETLWNEPANSQLKTARVNPNVLLPGDRVTVPEKQRKDEPIAAEQRHRFKRRGEPARLKVRLLFADQPLSGRPYTIKIDGRDGQPGTTDGDGNIDVGVASNAKRAIVTLGEGDHAQVFEFDIGKLSPASEVIGAQMRLENLGYLPVETDGVLGPATEASLKAFQHETGLPVTGKLDPATQQKLIELHGS
ncbi:MAG: peptidoglycan-binding protein [Phycisphaerae bacterium]